MDIKLPDMEGHEATKKIREFLKRKQTRIIAISAFHDELVQRKMSKSGLDGAIHKPVTLDTFKQALEGLNLLKE